jgi:hypothetical protein
VRDLYLDLFLSCRGEVAEGHISAERVGMCVESTEGRKKGNGIENGEGNGLATCSLAWAANMGLAA